MKSAEPRDTLPSLRQVEDDDVLVHWSEDDDFDAEGTDNEESNSDESSDADLGSPITF